MPALASPGKAAEAIAAWSFDKDTAGWQYDGKWAYKGKPAVAHTQAVGGGALKADVDFRPTQDKDWSEVKLGQSDVSEEKPLDLGNANRIGFDFYDQEKAMTTGAFKTKISMKTQDGKEVQAIADIDTKGATRAKDGWMKAHILVPFTTPETPVTLLEVNLVGSLTDYCGPLAVDNITLSYDDGYVARTVAPTKQRKLDLRALYPAVSRAHRRTGDPRGREPLRLPRGHRGLGLRALRPPKRPPHVRRQGLRHLRHGQGLPRRPPHRRHDDRWK